MQIPITENITSVVNSNIGMKRYLESLPVKKPQTPRSWWADGKHGNPYLTPEDAKKKWLTILATLQDKGPELKNIYDFDTSWLEKWGPQGGHPAIDVWMPLIEESFSDLPQPPAFETPEWQEAINSWTAILRSSGMGELYPRSYDRVILDLATRDRLLTNSGFPAFGKRSKPEVRSEAIRHAKSGEWKNFPAIVLFRYYNGKLRFVWMFPYATNLVEGSWTQPIQAAAMNSKLATTFFSPWKGFDAVRDRITWAYDNGYQIAASDFSSTDMHFRACTSSQVFEVLKQLFALGVNTDDLKESIEHMQQIPLLVGTDIMLGGEHGVASGSAWTNQIETIFDGILSQYMDAKTRHHVQGLYAIGDDMTWVSKAFPKDFATQLEDIGQSVGQVIKAEKTTVFPDRVKSLQRLFQRDYRRADGKVRGVYRTCKALNSIIFPERFHEKGWDSNMFCARTYAILENCVDHPLFREFVEFIVKGNKHLIPFAKKSRDELDVITRRARSLPGLYVSYNQEKEQESLANFESIRIAAEVK